MKRSWPHLLLALIALALVLPGCSDDDDPSGPDPDPGLGFPADFAGSYSSIGGTMLGTVAFTIERLDPDDWETIDGSWVGTDSNGKAWTLEIRGFCSEQHQITLQVGGYYDDESSWVIGVVTGSSDDETLTFTGNWTLNSVAGESFQGTWEVARVR